MGCLVPSWGTLARSLQGPLSPIQVATVGISLARGRERGGEEEESPEYPSPVLSGTSQPGSRAVVNFGLYECGLCVQTDLNVNPLTTLGQGPHLLALAFLPVKRAWQPLSLRVPKKSIPVIVRWQQREGLVKGVTFPENGTMRTGSRYGKRIEMRAFPAETEVGGGRLAKGDSGLSSFVHPNTRSSLANKPTLSPSRVADRVPGTADRAVTESQPRLQSGGLRRSSRANIRVVWGRPAAQLWGCPARPAAMLLGESAQAPGAWGLSSPGAGTLWGRTSHLRGGVVPGGGR